MNEQREIIVVGAGGHASVVIDALLLSDLRPVFIVDDDPLKRGTQIGGVMVRGSVSELSPDELKRLTTVVAVAKNEVRRKLVLELQGRGARISGLRHPSAVVSPQAFIDPTAQIMAGVIVNAGAQVKAHAVLNTGCIIEHDAKIGEFTHIGPGAVLAGAAELEQGVFVATGAKVCPFVRIGHSSTVGAGAVALRDVADGRTVVGIPAEPIKRSPGR